MSHPKWPMVPLGELIKRNENIAEIVEGEKYQEVTIRLWGKGVVRRQYVDGADQIGARRFRVSAGQFIVSRIDARNGAMGIVPEELNNAIVTNDFPSFNVNEDRLLPSFIGWLCRTKAFVDICRAASEGTTNRVRLKKDRFLDMAIPLPKLDEQERLVRKVDHLVTLLEEARELRVQSIENCTQVCRSILSNTRYGKPTPTLMSELVRWRKPNISVDPSRTYDFAGVYCFGRGVFRGGRKAGSDFSYKQLTQLQAGDFVYPKLMAWEGAMGIVPSQCDGLFVSPEFPVFTVDRERICPEALDAYFRSPSVWPQLCGSSTGTNVRRRRLNPKDFLNLEFPLPTKETQDILVRVRNKIAKVQEQQEPSAELDAMMPSILDRAFKGEL